MSHRRLDRVADRLAPDEHSNEELDRAIERGFEEIRRNFGDEGPQMIADIIEECRPGITDTSGQERPS